MQREAVVELGGYKVKLKQIDWRRTFVLFWLRAGLNFTIFGIIFLIAVTPLFLESLEQMEESPSVLYLAGYLVGVLVSIVAFAVVGPAFALLYALFFSLVAYFLKLVNRVYAATIAFFGQFVLVSFPVLLAILGTWAFLAMAAFSMRLMAVMMVCLPADPLLIVARARLARDLALINFRSVAFRPYVLVWSQSQAGAAWQLVSVEDWWRGDEG